MDPNLRQPVEAPKRQGQPRLPVRHVPPAQASDRSGVADLAETVFPPPDRPVDIGRRIVSRRLDVVVVVVRRVASIFKSDHRQQSEER